MDLFFVVSIGLIVVGYILGRLFHRPKQKIIYVHIPDEDQRQGPGCGTMLFLIIVAGMVFQVLGIV
jgi:hypothetical protein